MCLLVMLCRATREARAALKQRTVERFLERKPKLGRHELIKKRIDGRAEVVGDSRHVRKPQVEVHQKRSVWVVGVCRHISGEQSLRVERQPASEKRHNDGDCVGVGD